MNPDEKMLHEVRKSVAEQRASARIDEIGHSSVQPWSAGDIFPYVIAQHEHYEDCGDYANATLPLEMRRTGVTYSVSGNGRLSPRFRTYCEAAEWAQAQLRPTSRDLFLANYALDGE